MAKTHKKGEARWMQQMLPQSSIQNWRHFSVSWLYTSYLIAAISSYQCMAATRATKCQLLTTYFQLVCSLSILYNVKSSDIINNQIFLYTENTDHPRTCPAARDLRGCFNVGDVNLVNVLHLPAQRTYMLITKLLNKLRYAYKSLRAYVHTCVF